MWPREVKCIGKIVDGGHPWLQELEAALEGVRVSYRFCSGGT
jgi:hypothetical protein